MRSDPLRVLVVGLNYAPEPTGIAPYTRGMAAGLRARGHDVSVVTAFPHYPQWRVMGGYSGWRAEEKMDGVSLSRVRHYVPKRPTWIARAFSEISFGARSSTCRWMNPDVVICVSPGLLSSALSMTRTLWGRRRPAFGLVMQDLYSVGISETATGLGVVSKVIGMVESWVARHADGVVVIHEGLRKRVVHGMGVSPERVVTLRNWTHVAPLQSFDRQAVRHSLGWRDDETVVLHSGAMGVKQGLANVLEAARTAKCSTASVRFVLMGDGGQRSTLERQAAGLETVQFLDPVAADQYAQVLGSADVLLVNESAGVMEMAVPSKLTSYFSTGLPVVAATSAQSTTATEVRAARAGVIIPPEDPVALIEAVLDLAGDRARAHALGAHGPRYCSDVLAEESALDGYDRWVRELYEVRNQREGQR